MDMAQKIYFDVKSSLWNGELLDELETPCPHSFPTFYESFYRGFAASIVWCS